MTAPTSAHVLKRVIGIHFTTKQPTDADHERLTKWADAEFGIGNYFTRTIHAWDQSDGTIRDRLEAVEIL